MMHKNRRWTVAVVATVGVLAEKLTENSWCVCNGWLAAEIAEASQ